MRLSINEEILQLIDEILDYCKTCDDILECDHQYLTRKDVVKSALSKFSEQDCRLGDWD